LLVFPDRSPDLLFLRARLRDGSLTCGNFFPPAFFGARRPVDLFSTAPPPYVSSSNPALFRHFLFFDQFSFRCGPAPRTPPPPVFPFSPLYRHRSATPILTFPPPGTLLEKPLPIPPSPSLRSPQYPLFIPYWSFLYLRLFSKLSSPLLPSPPSISFLFRAFSCPMPPRTLPPSVSPLPTNYLWGRLFPGLSV